MKLLLDESVPRQLGGFFPDTFEVHTVHETGISPVSGTSLMRTVTSGSPFGGRERGNGRAMGERPHRP